MAGMVATKNMNPGERRLEGRVTLVFRPVIIELDGFVGLCLMRNLSSEGMMGEIGGVFAPGAPITVQLNDHRRIGGVIAWSDEGRIGIHFHEPIDLNAAFEEFGSKQVGGLITRAPRLPIRCPGEVILPSLVVGIELVDISQAGVKIRASCLCPGDEVRIRLEGMALRKAIVRWVHMDTAGLSFVSPLGFEELADWALQRQSGPDAPPWGSESPSKND